MKKIGILGHFAFGKNLLNGQTIKTKIIYDQLVEQFSEMQIACTDTNGGAKRLPAMVWGCLKLFTKCKNIIMLPAHNGLRIFAPLLVLLNVFFKRRLHYIVIGGWLPEYLCAHKMLKKFLLRFDYIYVETNFMKIRLDDIGFKNTVVMHNFKVVNVISEDDICAYVKRPFRFCTFSRVSREKGIEDAIEAVKLINIESDKIECTLDIYGSIDADYVNDFEVLSKDFPEYIKYCGNVDYSQSTQVLKNYYALLFPTYYPGEGFAGTLIDAFSSALPVLASDWKYNAEIVIDGYNGIIFKHRDVEMLKNSILDIINDSNKHFEMKKNCIYSAKKYLPEIAVMPLLENLM